MKNNIIKILVGALLLSNISIPTFAYVDNKQVEIYKTRLNMIKSEFTYSSGINDGLGLSNSETKAKTLLSEINYYTKANTNKDFATQCSNMVETMEKYRVYKYNKLREESQEAGFGTMYGRESYRLNVDNYLDTCDMLLSDLDNYRTSFSWYVKEANEDYEHWRLEDGNWKFYNSDGEKLKNTTVDGYVLGSDGSLIR